MIKQIFDYLLASLLLLVFCIPMIFLWIACSISTQQNGLFLHQRVGKNQKEFWLWKYKTMKGKYTSSITTQQMQITTFGKIIRKYKLDELPQLINVLKGEMSFVGARPDTKDIIELLDENEKKFLQLKPGISGIAQLKYKNEEILLAQQQNPEEYYRNIIWKDKAKLNNWYYENQSFSLDLKILLCTIFPFWLDDFLPKNLTLKPKV